MNNKGRKKRNVDLFIFYLNLNLFNRNITIRNRPFDLTRDFLLLIKQRPSTLHLSIQCLSQIKPDIVIAQRSVSVTNYTRLQLVFAKLTTQVGGPPSKCFHRGRYLVNYKRGFKDLGEEHYSIRLYVKQDTGFVGLLVQRSRIVQGTDSDDGSQYGQDNQTVHVN